MSIATQSILTLPIDVFYLILDRLVNPSDRLSLACTCRALHAFIIPTRLRPPECSKDQLRDYRRKFQSLILLRGAMAEEKVRPTHACAHTASLTNVNAGYAFYCSHP